MNREQFSALRDSHYAKIAEINDRKGHDYAGAEDALANFKKDSERFRRIALRDPKMAKWYTYFDKHYEAVMTFLEEGDVKSEPIEGRVHDCILYLFLLLGLIEEDAREADDVTDARKRIDEHIQAAGMAGLAGLASNDPPENY